MLSSRAAAPLSLPLVVLLLLSNMGIGIDFRGSESCQYCYFIIKRHSQRRDSHNDQLRSFIRDIAKPTNQKLWADTVAGCRALDLQQSSCTAKRLTGLFSIFCLLFRPFLMWLFKALESSGFRSSKLHSSSLDTDMTAPQLSNSPQYCISISFMRETHRG